MNVNMKLTKEELNSVFETLLKTALASNVTLNFNICLEEVATTEIKLVDNSEVVEEVMTMEDIEKEETKVITLARCLECGCVQAVNSYFGTCYVCGDTLPTDSRPYDENCTSCGEHIRLDILGKGVDYVSCNSCKKKHTIKLDFNHTKWVNKYQY